MLPQKTHKYSSHNQDEDEPIKEITRVYKKEAIDKNPVPWNKQGNMATLPFKFRFEQMMLTLCSNQFIFYCFEKVFKHYNNMKVIAEQIGKKHFQIMPYEIGSILKHPYLHNIGYLKDFFVFLDLDYMEQLVTQNKGMTSELLSCFKNKLIKLNCCMSVTIVDRHLGYDAKKHLQYARIGELKDILDNATRIGATSGEVTDSQHIIISWLLENMGNDYVIEKFIIYNDSLFDEKGKMYLKRHQMLMVIIRRIN